MANQKAMSMTISEPGVEIMIWYNDTNLRIGSVEWTIPALGIVVRVRIWDSNISATVPVIDRTEGQGSDEENIPGNYQMIEMTDPDVGTYYEFPGNIAYTFLIRQI
jgi:hypothetical protein